MLEVSCFTYSFDTYPVYVLYFTLYQSPSSSINSQLSPCESKVTILELVDAFSLKFSVSAVTFRVVVAFTFVI